MTKFGGEKKKKALSSCNILLYVKELNDKKETILAKHAFVRADLCRAVFALQRAVS